MNCDQIRRAGTGRAVLMAVLAVMGLAVPAVMAGTVPPVTEKVPVICATCECLGTVPFDVDCTTTELREVPDLSVNNFTFPWELDFANNIIYEVPQLPLLHNLLSLSFKRNHVRKIADGAFMNLPDLKDLSFQFNNLTEESLLEDVFKGNYNSTYPEPLPLEKLDLSYNNIRSLRRNALRHLPFLKHLFLSHNPIEDITWNMAAAITELHSLEELDLSQTGLNRLPSHFLADLTKLRVLTLAGNQFTSVPSEVQYAHTLVHLNLNANPIVTVMAGDFQEGLSTLQVLEMSAMPALRNVGVNAFTSLRGLQVLKMSDNPQLSVIDRKAFRVTQDDDLALQQIHIQNNNLMVLEEELLPWLALTYVDIQNNPWNCDCNFRWVAETLLPDLEAKNPQTTLSILCAEPIADRANRVADLLGRAHTFECGAPRPFVSEEGHYGVLIVSSIVVGVLLLFTGTLVFTYVLFRRTRTRQMFGDSVKYRRAYNDDVDTMNQTVHS
ncbi:chondroadherin isoform X2 [Procambarus clarkii]|nr:leucine-rich repeat neuronal protein 1-like isoform X3 [Procambarus clarkii]